MVGRRQQPAHNPVSLIGFPDLCSVILTPLCRCLAFVATKPVAGSTRRFMLAFIAATAAVETVIQNTVSVTADLTNGETKTYKLVLDVDVR